MKKPFVVLLHCGYWVLYLLLLAIVFATVTLQVKKTPLQPSIALIFPIMVMYLAPNMISFYLFYFLLFPRFLYRKNILALVVFGILVCLISAVSGNLLALVLFGFDQPIFTDTHEFLTLTISLSLVAAIHGIIALIVRGFITWYAEIKLKEELAQKSFEMELAFCNVLEALSLAAVEAPTTIPLSTRSPASMPELNCGSSILLPPMDDKDAFDDDPSV